MAINTPGIAIVIRAFLPTGKTLDEQFEALSLVKDAHASGDYSKLLAAASIDDVKTEQKVRRMEEPAAAPAPHPDANIHGIGPDVGGGLNPDYVEPEFAEVDEDEPTVRDAAGNFEDGLDDPREEPDTFADTGDVIPWSEEAEETISLIDGPLDQVVAEPAAETAPRRRMAR